LGAAGNSSSSSSAGGALNGGTGSAADLNDMLKSGFAAFSSGGDGGRDRDRVDGLKGGGLDNIASDARQDAQSAADASAKNEKSNGEGFVIEWK
jgi:hypothetical protein